MDTLSVTSKNCTVCQKHIAAEKERVNCPGCHMDWHGKCQPKDNKCPACGVAVKPFMSPLFHMLMALFGLLTAIRLGAGVIKDMNFSSEILILIVMVIVGIAMACGIAVLFTKIIGKKAEPK